MPDIFSEVSKRKKEMYFFIKYLFILNSCVWAHVNLHAPHLCRYLQRPEKGVRSSRTVGICGFELLNVGDRNRTGVFCRDSKCSNH